MTATIHRLHNPNQIAGYLRVGHRDHKWLEDQLARGALPYRRFVFEASHIRQQRQSSFARIRHAASTAKTT